MSLKSFLKITLVAAGLCASGLLQAQSMYRCGSVYQDRPCDGKDPGKRIGSTGSSEPAYKPVADAECAQRGADTLKIVWRREAGASAQKQMDDIDAQRAQCGMDQKRLIAEVYNKRGSAPEVRAAIEADCVQEKEKAAQAAAWAAAMPTAGKAPSANGASTSASSETEVKTSDARRREDDAAREEANRKRVCDDLKSDLADIQGRQRTGGDVREMERLNQKSRDKQSQLNRGGC